MSVDNEGCHVILWCHSPRDCATSGNRSSKLPSTTPIPSSLDQNGESLSVTVIDTFWMVYGVRCDGDAVGRIGETEALDGWRRLWMTTRAI